jgi:hypothetical protein
MGSRNARPEQGPKDRTVQLISILLCRHQIQCLFQRRNAVVGNLVNQIDTGHASSVKRDELDT